MRMLRATIQISLCFLLIHTTIATADIQASSSCLRNGTERHVELRSDSPNSVPCQVVYVRKSEQIDDKVLWFANKDASYCKTQYDRFLLRLKTELNWTCTPEVIGSALSDSANVVDDPIVRDDKTDGLIEPQLQLEPDFQPPVPVTSIGNSSTQPLTAAPEPKPLTKATLEYFIPSGFYTLDESASQANNTGNCPTSGYFVWNTRDPARPVFELGATLEFELNIENVESIVEAPVVTLPPEFKDGADSCTTFVSFSSCQYPDFRQGTDSWQTNNGSFDCSYKSTTADQRYVSFALFQNREQIPSTATCSAQNQVIHFALAALSQGYQNAVKQTPNAIEVAISTGKRQKLNRCRYVRSTTQ